MLRVLVILALHGLLEAREVELWPLSRLLLLWLGLLLDHFFSLICPIGVRLWLSISLLVVGELGKVLLVASKILGFGESGLSGFEVNTIFVLRFECISFSIMSAFLELVHFFVFVFFYH